MQFATTHSVINDCITECKCSHIRSRSTVFENVLFYLCHSVWLFYCSVIYKPNCQCSVEHVSSLAASLPSTGDFVSLVIEFRRSLDSIISPLVWSVYPCSCTNVARTLSCTWASRATVRCQTVLCLCSIVLRFLTWFYLMYGIFFSRIKLKRSDDDVAHKAAERLSSIACPLTTVRSVFTHIVIRLRRVIVRTVKFRNSFIPHCLSNSD